MSAAHAPAPFPAGLDGPVWLLGCGTMAGAMLGRWLAAGLDPARVTAINRSGRPVAAGVRVLTAPPPDERPGLLVLGVKPQQLGAVAPLLAAAGPGLLVSILAGVEAATLAAAAPGAAVVRAMPNLPVATGRGVVALHAPELGDGDRALLDALMAPLGLVEWIADQGQFDAVTALAGCGPAFLFRFVDALAGAGAALGLEAGQARRLALATVDGAAGMAASADVTPAVLADRVASPGGSTREGLNVLDRDRALAQLLAETLAAAAARNRAMAAEARAGG